MNTLESEKALLEDILKDLEDMTPRLVLADLYEEQGDLVRASCWRWFARNRSRPSKIHIASGRPYFWNTRDYLDRFHYSTQEDHIPLSGIPDCWLEEITFRTHYPCNKFYASEREAFLEAVEAWCNDLTDQERRECEQWK